MTVEPGNPSEVPQACDKCGARSVRPRARAGRTVAHRNLPALPVPADFAVPTCGRCGAEIFDAATRAALLPILEAEYRETLRRLIRQKLDKLTNHTSQRRLESLLGLSQGYLSRLRSGSGMPSPELVGHLALLANDPDVRLQELERFWRGLPVGAMLHGMPMPMANESSPESPAPSQPAATSAEDPTAILS